MALAHARELARSGRQEQAREAIHASLATRALDSDTLSLVRDMALRTGRAAHDRPHCTPRTQVDLVVRGSIGARDERAELVPTVAFVAAPGAAAWRGADRLLGVFSPHAGPDSLVRSYVAWGGERVIEFRVPLRTPWRVSPGHEIRAIRVLSLPCEAASSKFRRRLLRSVSAVAVVVEPEVDDAATVEVVRGLDADLRRAGGHSLDSFPLLFQYTSAEQAERHAALTSALLLPSVAWALADPESDTPGEAASAFALLLLEVGRGVQCLMRPRGTV